ncbi:hypothetical protein ACFOY4_34925 [Actinomadura syzygii]|nr:hypothetical protein [Actinomadura syzygii]
MTPACDRVWVLEALSDVDAAVVFEVPPPLLEGRSTTRLPSNTKGTAS